MTKIMKKRNCNWRNCPIRFGFEIYFQGEKEEKHARKHLYPFIEKFFKAGNTVISRYYNTIKNKE